ncbi:hypothetical protein BKA61DRAFT_578473 [Leptodontidium sp. MPI-SDFR-AT-0119]|nr:hypothetical protein BKA61DRAFT_578473 [Leptodontidium sp. MPI-SDFR-AT-0119]
MLKQIKYKVNCAHQLWSFLFFHRSYINLHYARYLTHSLLPSTPIKGKELIDFTPQAGGFSGCDGCKWNGNFERFSLRVSAKCGNAHIKVGVNTDTDGGGDSGEDFMVRDCNGKAGGGTKPMNICAGDGWSLFRC